MAANWKIVVVRAWVDSGVVKARLVSSDGSTETAGSVSRVLGVLETWLGALVQDTCFRILSKVSMIK
jgi:hypothetical protein